MPRRPTRSRSNKPTRKELNRRIDDIESGDSEPTTLADVIETRIGGDGIDDGETN